MGGIRLVYAAEIKTPKGSRITVRIESDCSSHARELLETLYGRGNVLNLRKIFP